MKRLLFLFALLNFFAEPITAQEPAADTTVYQVAESLPFALLAPCQPGLHPGWTEDSIRRCADSYLMQLLAQNIRYPAAAREQNLEGTVVTSFIVETNGRISNLQLLKDIGGGCGDEAIRVLQALDEAGLRWRPALNGGKPVRMQSVIPLRFRLEEAPPYVVNPEGDTVHTVLDAGPEFRGGVDSLYAFVLNQLKYPKSMLDSCRTGVIEMALLIRSTGGVSVGNLLDYSNLGLDFQFEAIRLANRTARMWTPAQFEDHAVNATYPLRVLFKSPQEGCAAANERFDRAMLLAEEGAVLSDAGDRAAAIAKWSEALELHPDNTEILYYRGSEYFSENRREEGCQDYNRIRELLGTTWFETIRRLLCGG